MNLINRVLNKIDVTLFVIYGFMGIGSVYLGAFIRSQIDMAFWPEIFILRDLWRLPPANLFSDFDLKFVFSVTCVGCLRQTYFQIWA